MKPKIMSNWMVFHIYVNGYRRIYSDPIQPHHKCHRWKWIGEIIPKWPN